MQYKQIILSKLIDYLKYKKIKLSRGHIKTFSCPFCGKTATLLPNSHYVNCFFCRPKENFGEYFTVIDIARKLDKPDASDEEILQYLKDILNIKVMTKQDEVKVEDILKKYQEWGFDLVPIVTNGKIPAEKEWTKKTHKDINEWMRWIKDGLNIGVKTGKVSNIIVVDIDQKPIPNEIKNLLRDDSTFIQETTKGYHLFYKYDSDLPKTRIDEIKIDIENDGGQVVIYPSRIKDKERKIQQFGKIAEMPEELKEYLKKQMTVPRKTQSEKISEDIQTEDFNLGVLGEGQRNSSLVRIGGILRKELNKKQTEYTLHMLNKVLCKRPLPVKEMRAMINSLDKYTHFDEKELAHKVLEYLRDIEEANRNEIAMAIVGTNRGEEKKRIDKALQYLVKERYVSKIGRSYSIRKKVEWKETLINIGVPIDFQMPYFYDLMHFHFGDLIIIGSRNATGKTHIAMNIVKQLVEQKITPYYLSLEGGSRWAKIALQLGLKERDFKWEETSNPNNVELEQNAITIIDWLCPKSYAETDKILQNLNDKVRETKGILIVFVQLRDNNEWLAKDLIKQFPAFACRYIYDNEDSGEYGKFKIDKLRDAKIRIKSYELPAYYNWETKELILVSELEQKKKLENEE